MSRKKRFRHEAKKAAKIEKLALAGLTTVTVGMVGANNVYADDVDTTPASSLVEEVASTVESVATEGSLTSAATAEASVSASAEEVAAPVVHETSVAAEVPAGEVVAAEVARESATAETTESVEAKDEEVQASATPVKRSIVVETEEDIPAIKEISVDKHEILIDESVNVSISFNEFEQPFMLKSTFTNIETGDKKTSMQVVERQAVYDYSQVKYLDTDGNRVDSPYPDGSTGGKGASGTGYRIDPSTIILSGYAYDATVYQYFDKAGNYKLSLEILNLENEVLVLDEDSRKKIAHLPEIKVTEGQFIEGNLVEVKVDKKAVDQGEKFTYTLYFDSKVQTTKSVGIELKSENAYSYGGYLINDSSANRSYVEITFTSDSAGEVKPMFDTDLGYHYYSDGDYKTLALISEANIAKLNELAPMVTVSDQVYSPAKLTVVKIVSKDGTETVLEEVSVLSSDYDWETFKSFLPLLRLNVGDKIVYTYQIDNDYIGGTIHQEYVRRGTDFTAVIRGGVEKIDEITDNSTTSRISKEIHSNTENVELVITENMMGLYWLFSHSYGDLYISGLGVEDYNISHDYAYYFAVNNPSYKEPEVTIVSQPTKVYSGQNANISANLDNVSAEKIESFELNYTNENGESANGHLVPEKENIYAGGVYFSTYQLSQVVVNFEDGTKIALDNIPTSIIVHSDEKKWLGGVLLSGDDVVNVDSIDRQGVYSNLGRLPAELLNRNLYVEKIIAMDMSGEIVNLTNADIRLNYYSSGDEGVEYFYYLPISGAIAKLTPDKINDGLFALGISDISGVFVTAYPIEATEPSSDANYKVVTNEDTTIQVALVNADVRSIAKIQTSVVTDKETLDKLPETHKANDIDLYDIKTVDAEGNFVQIQEEATVTLPVNPRRKVTKIFYFLPEIGAIEELDFDWDQSFNQVSFKVSHFSQYGIQYEADPESDSLSSTYESRKADAQKLWDDYKGLLEKASKIDSALYTEESYSEVVSHLNNHADILAGTKTLDSVLAEKANNHDFLTNQEAIIKGDITNLTNALERLVEKEVIPEEPLDVVESDTSADSSDSDTPETPEAPTEVTDSTDSTTQEDLTSSDKADKVVNNNPTSNQIQAAYNRVVTKTETNKVITGKSAIRYQAPNALPKTGDASSVTIALMGILMSSMGIVGLKKRKR